MKKFFKKSWKTIVIAVVTLLLGGAGGYALASYTNPNSNTNNLAQQRQNFLQRFSNGQTGGYGGRFFRGNNGQTPGNGTNGQVPTIPSNGSNPDTSAGASTGGNGSGTTPSSSSSSNSQGA